MRLPPALQRELESALEDADQAPGISAEELFAELRRYQPPQAGIAFRSIPAYRAVHGTAEVVALWHGSIEHGTARVTL